jgi:ribonuclease Z
LSQNSLSVTILGSSAALPANHRNPTSQLLKSDQSYYLIDCGEGTQSQMRRYHLKMQRIKVVFISHLHGDHYFGLLGMLNSMHLLGRTSSIHIVCPVILKDIIDLQMKAGGGRMQFPIAYTFTDEVDKERKLIYQDDHILVDAFRLKHRIPCCGFVFNQKEKPRKYNAEAGAKYNVSIKDIPRIKAGENYTTIDGRVVPNKELTLDPDKPKSYAFCTDTLPLENTIEQVLGVDCLYHESTFSHIEKKRAKATFHSTTKDAANIAHEAKVGKLVLGHYSARYSDLSILLEEAKEVFDNTILALEGEEINI